ncbi:ABC transporter permease [Paenibacillus illinoisensis]|uniref:Binding-protein-dependent transport system inner membrane protein n=1 Tax=Paenibacillus illinoisensis TaxID=59845 RepID=A0A2W0C939_9BACL|nr:ABC transporter permease [Paenibacillus illinoisensis]PYY29483.1 Binding-protein-dependent transport system inner membrane protein [Paenibacillus illinoisensis]
MREGVMVKRSRDENGTAAVSGSAALPGSAMAASVPGSEIQGQQGQAEQERPVGNARSKRVILHLLPWLAGLCFLALWQLRLFHQLFSLESYQLPVPSAIAASIRDNAEMLFRYALYSGTEMLGGFLLGSLLGAVAAAGASFFPISGKAGIAVMSALNAVPIVALAPIMNNWFGDGIWSRIAVVAVITMAAMAVSLFKGLTSIQPQYGELLDGLAASRMQVFLKLRLPHAMPSLFAGLKINMSTSIIGAIVGEFFIASQGLGYLLSDQIRLANMPLAWSCIVIAAALGIVLYEAVVLAEKRLIPWNRVRTNA